MKLHKNQRGLGVVEIVIILVLLLGIAGAGYYVLNRNKDKSDNGTTVRNTAAQSECEKHFNDKDFCRFASSWTYGGEQKMTIRSSDVNSVTVMETDGNGNTRMVTTRDGAEESGFISIGNTSYMKNVEDGSWMKSTSDTSEDILSDPSEEIGMDFDFESEAAKDTTTLTKDGKEACGNLTCFKYTITDSSAPDEVTTLWFDDSEYRLRRIGVTSSAGSSDITFEYQVAPITEPSPVVDMPDFSGFGSFGN